MELHSRENYNIPKYSKDNCPFCRLDEANIIWKGEYFYIQHAKYPYLMLEKHLLVIPYEHIINTCDISKKAFWEFSDIEKFMYDFYAWWDYFSFIRESNSSKSRSVEHLHYHFLPGVINPEDVEYFLSKQF